MAETYEAAIGRWVSPGREWVVKSGADTSIRPSLATAAELALDWGLESGARVIQITVDR